jgi:hypothetical protein
MKQMPDDCLKWRLMGLVLAALWALAPSASHAGDITWTNAAGGNFSNPLNWNPNQVPGVSDTAIFNITTPGPYTVTWSVPVTNYRFKVERGTLDWNLGGHKYTVTYGGPVLGVAGNTLDMTVTNGQLAIATSAPYYGIRGNTRVRVAANTSGNIGRLTSSGVESGATLIVDGAPLGQARYNVYAGGALVITNNGSLDAGTGTISYNQGSVVRMAGTGTWTRLLNMTIDCGASGGVYLSDGAQIKVWNFSGKPVLKSGSHVFLDNGQLFDTGTLFIEGGVIEGRGKIGSTTYNGGWIRPGGTAGVGVITNSASLVNTNGSVRGTIELELNGTAAGASDRLAVLGTLHAFGTLAVSLIDGFKPDSGNTFDILDFTSTEGEFETLDLPGAEANWDIKKLYTTGEIRYRPTGTVLMVQ